jgi:hypothetical protein
LTLGCGSTLGTFAVVHEPSVLAAVAVGVGLVAVVVGNVVAGLSSGLPAIIAALSAKKVAGIKAKTDAKVALEGARRRTALVNAGLDGKLDTALRPAEAPRTRRPGTRRSSLSEDMLRELLPGPRAPFEEDARLAGSQPRKPAAPARHAKQDAQPVSPVPIDVSARRSHPRSKERLWSADKHPAFLTGRQPTWTMSAAMMMPFWTVSVPV